MDRCPNCGATVRVGAKFCTTCGMRLPTPAATTATNEESTRSPFDSTSTVASRWPARSAYGSTESASTETVEEAPLTPTEESLVAEAVVEAEPAAGTEAGEAASTWGAWSAPPATETETEEKAASTPSDTPPDSEESGAWGAAEQAPTQTTAEETPSDETAVEPDQSQEEASTSWVRSGETDFLQLPEQPDPSAWKSIESQLSGAPETEADAEAEQDFINEEAVVEEAIEEAPAAGAPVERALTLLDELKTIITDTSTQLAAYEAAEPAAEPPSLEHARPSDEAVARFAELRAAVETAREHPRDIDTMLDLSRRLDLITELLDAHDNLYQAAFGDSARTAVEEPDED